MKTIKVLGSGCKKCRITADIIDAAAAKLGIPITLEKVEDFDAIASYAVMATPSVVIDGEVVHTGGVPTAAAIEAWLRSGAEDPRPPRGNA